MKRLIVVIVVAVLATGCFGKQARTPDVPPETDPRPLTLTTEEVIPAEDGSGDLLITYFPKGVSEPVVFFNEETGQYGAAARIPKP